MKRGMTTAVAAGVALATLFLGIPAGAEEADQMVSDTLGSSTAATSESVPENPSQKLPDEVADSVPEDSTLVSPSLATDSDGTVYDVQTGTEVTDPALVGTDEAPADPLAKTDGESFIPVDISDVKEKVEGNFGATSSDSDVQNSRFVSSAAPRVQPAFLDNNSYGAHWGTYNGTPAFFENNGNLFVQQAQGVIDISQWQGDINWDAVKATGNVQGVIVRLGYGHDNALDTKAARNISELRRLGIPFGVYWYSYSADAGFSTQEARSTVAALRQLGIQPGELKYPVYYDMERWTWKGHAPSTDPNVNAAAMRAYISTMNASGYTNVDVYSYTSYLNSALKHNDIWRKTSWVAQYGARMGFTAWNTNFRGWQYSSTGHVNGISGNVDINAFGNHEYTASMDVRTYPLVTIDDGEYYINSRLSEKISAEIAGAATNDGVQLSVYQYNHSAAQKFKFTRQNDGSYVIRNTSSGKVIDVNAAVAGNGARVQQWDTNGSAAQKWFIRNLGNGYAIQSALGNWVLDIAGAGTANGTSMQLYSPNGSDAQKFFFASTSGPQKDVVMRIASMLNSEKVADVDSGSLNNSAAVRVWDWNASKAQQFVFKEVGNGTYIIENANSHKVLDVNGNASLNGSIISQYDFNNSSAQQWIIRRNSDNSYSFQGRGSGKFMEVPGANTNPGTRLAIYDGNGTTAQKWDVQQATNYESKEEKFVREHSGDIKDGLYEFARPQKKSSVMEVQWAQTTNYANILLYTSNNTRTQHWHISHDSFGYVVIKNDNSGKVLDVNAALARNGQNVQQYDANNTDAQKWVAVRNSDSSYTFYSKLNIKYALDVSGDSTSDGTNVQIWAANGTNGQKWSIQSANLVEKHKNDMPNGTYEFLRPNAHRVALDVQGASHTNAANVQLYSSNHTGAQQWEVSHDAEGYVILKNKNSGKVLDIRYGVATSEQNVWQYDANGSAAQKWIAVKNSDGTYTFYSKLDTRYALDVQGNGTANGTNVRIYAANGSEGQKWEINGTGFAESHKYDLADGTVSLARPQKNNAVMEVQWALSTNGANVWVYQANGTNAQKWKIRHLNSHYVVLENVATGKVLDVDSGVARSGQNIRQWQWNGTKAQQWVAVLNTNGTYTLHSALDSTLVIDTAGDSTANYTNIRLWKQNNTNGQQWKLTR